jgi:uncharacterized protein (TIGR03066 family)
MKTKTHKGSKEPANSAAPSPARALGRWIAIVLVVAVVAGASFAAFEFLLPDRIPPELVGKWRVVDGPPNLNGMTMEFKRNGDMIGRATVNGKDFAMEGTAVLDDKTLHTTTTNLYTGRSETGMQTIVTLTENELVTRDQKGTRLTMTRVR